MFIMDQNAGCYGVFFCVKLKIISKVLHHVFMPQWHFSDDDSLSDMLVTPSLYNLHKMRESEF